MPSLQVRELPEPIYRKLLHAAEREHRSLAQQAVATLARGLGMVEDPKSRRREVLERIHRRPVKKPKFKVPDPVKLVREDRNR